MIYIGQIWGLILSLWFHIKLSVWFRIMLSKCMLKWILCISHPSFLFSLHLSENLMFHIDWVLTNIIRILSFNFNLNICCCSVAQSCLTLCSPMNCNTQGFLVLHVSLSLLKLMSTEAVMPSNRLFFGHPLSLLALSLSQGQGIFQWVSSSIRWPKYWSFSFSLSPSNEYSGLISFRMGWFDLQWGVICDLRLRLTEVNPLG